MIHMAITMAVQETGWSSKCKRLSRLLRVQIHKNLTISKVYYLTNYPPYDASCRDSLHFQSPLRLASSYFHSDIQSINLIKSTHASPLIITQPKRHIQTIKELRSFKIRYLQLRSRVRSHPVCPFISLVVSETQGRLREHPALTACKRLRHTGEAR